MRILTLPVKKEYFEQIKNGSKIFEYRLVKDYWIRRLTKGKHFDEIRITLGYPKRNDTKRTITRPWLGYEIQTITHKEFGDEPVKVFAIRVN